MDLEWTPPTKDGGSALIGYIVEKKDPITKEWVPVMETKEPKASVKGLKEGEEYQFRVRAVNKAGPGAPSDPSDKKIAKPRYGSRVEKLSVFVMNTLFQLLLGLT